MNKKFLISIGIFACLIFSFSACLATTDVINDVRNTAGTVEDKMENAVKDVSNTSKKATNTRENNIGSTFNNGNYNTTRVSTDNTVMGMTSKTWTWLIVGITAVAIMALIWYYTMQNSNIRNHHDDD